MKTLTLVIAVGVAGQGVPARRAMIDVPAALEGQPLELSVVCRDARGNWGGVEAWRDVGDEPPVVVVRNGCRALLRRKGAAVYLSSATMHDVDDVRRIPLQHQWLRTVRSAPAASQPYWVGNGTSGAECFRTPAASVCMFVGADESGAMVTVEESGIGFSLSPAGGTGSVGGWRAAPWGRLARVRAPSRSDWQARVSVLEPALEHGRDLLRRRRPSPAAVVHRIGDDAAWIEGRPPEAGARLEIAGKGAATARIDLSSVRGSPLTVFDVSLSPEEVIEGEVRSEGRLLGGATVTLTRLLAAADGASADKASAEKEDDRPMEYMGEVTTAATGRFRFDGLTRDEYELAVSHPRRGRASLKARAPSIQRIALEPRALLRGRVVASGVPVAGAVVSVLPSYDAILGARNPAALMAESVQTAADGRFELVAPDEGQLMLTALRDGAAARVALGDTRDLPPVLDMGDVTLTEPLEAVILLALPASCVLSAAGPLGQPGVLLQRADSAGPGRWVLRSAFEGRWLIEASCGGTDIPLDTSVIDIRGRSGELFRIAPRRDPVRLRSSRILLYIDAPS